MHRYSKILYHKDLIKLIKSFSSSFSGTFVTESSPLVKIRGDFQPKKKGFKVIFEYDRFKKTAKSLKVGATFKRIEFNAIGNKLILESIWLGKHSPPLFEGDVSFFYTKGYSKKKKYYYRLVFPLKDKLNFHYQIQEIIYTSDLVEWSRTGTKAVIDGDELIAYTFEDQDKLQYFAIECGKKLSYEIFSEKAFALKNAIGYLTNYMVGDGGFFFAYNRKKMQHFDHYYFCSLRDTIKGSLHLGITLVNKSESYLL